MTITSSNVQKKAPRAYQILECARLIAIISIVWLHTVESDTLMWTRDIGRFAVPFFTMASIFLAFSQAQRRRETTLGNFAISRFKRIYLVFLFWSIFYALVRFTSAKVLHSTPPHLSIKDIFWDGTTQHLWFLPFILIASFIGFAVGRLTEKLRGPYWAIVGILVITSLLFAYNHQQNTFRNFGYVAELSVDALPSLLLGLAVAMTYVRVPQELFDRIEVSILGALLWIGCIVVLVLTKRTIFLETLSGLGLMIMSLNRFQSETLSKMAKWGSLSLGIYILHVLFLDGFQDILHKKVGLAISWKVDIATFTIAVICSLGVTLALRNSKVKNLLS